MDVTFLKSPAEFRRWLAKNHATTSEKWVGFHKAKATKKGITYQEALDQALCFGWIDGVRKGLDEATWTIRFTPRKTKSYWSKVNIRRAQELSKAGLMHAAGLAAFDARDQKRTDRYAYEREASSLDAASVARFKRNKKAWDFFQAQAPSYRRTAAFWVVSAQKDETRSRRLALLIEDSANERRLKQFVSPARRKTPASEG